jgi:hypothetical protein
MRKTRHKSPIRWWAGAASAAAVVAVLAADAPGTTAASEQSATLAVPLRLSAFAVNMSNIATGTTAVMDLRITRWATPAEREGLITTAIEKGQDALLRALQRMPKHGRLSIPGWRGPDPHNVRLGWDLRYAANAPLDDGGQRITIATDRYIGFWEAREQPRTIDYPFSLIEIRLDRAGRGAGKMAVATKIEFDKKKQQMVLENYATEPLRLNEVKIER